MPNKMLIDASHPEETRVVVVHGSRIEEFDFESQDKKQLKGNIYLARVTRVEPSLQAAFVEYGGNRHGFLAFSEIHPDYYQIPVADRQALLRADAEAHSEEEDEDEERGRGRRRRRNTRGRGRGDEAGGEKSAADSDDTAQAGDDTVSASDEATPSGDDAGGAPDESHGAADDGEAAHDAAPGDDDTADKGGESIAAKTHADVISEEVGEGDRFVQPEGENGHFEESQENHPDEEIESVGAEDAMEEVQSRRRPVRRQYKIQEVIKRRQILLVQVVKEERGNKGAALTTYLSLAGRYSVLMPNTARGGGISRKITNAQDRKRLKEVVQDLEVPQGMGVILRTAGESRTKAEIKRDYEYLMRLWETVRTLTLESTAPALVYEEGSLIKRSVRDLYNKDIDEILVAGEDSYREAKDFMRMLMPSHAKVVQPYRETVPMFVRHGVEAQLDKMLQPQVNLKSGGYIIINQTEALVAIDVNSGRSTREHSIEETALHTNLEAAEEVARQLRLRDLAGLIVIDFIDMEENRNNRTVEKRLKDHLKNDRARIQLGRISHFGLMEMSRQRIRASVLESTTKPCPHCGGTGHVRSDSSVALLVVRAIEEFLLKDSRTHISVRTPTTTAMYVLNHKRSNLAELEVRFGVTITIETDDGLGLQHYAIVRGAVADKSLAPPPPVATFPEEIEDEVVVDEEEIEEAVSEQPERTERAERKEQSVSTGEGGGKRRKRRRRRGGRDRDRPTAEQATEGDDAGETDDAEAVAADGEDVEEAVAATASSAAPDDRKKRRRGRRGGKRNRTETTEGGADEDQSEAASYSSEADAPLEADTVTAASEAAEATSEAVAAPEAAESVDAPVEAPKKARRSSPRKKAAAEDAVESPAAAEEDATPAKRAPRRRTAKAKTKDEAEPIELPEPEAAAAEADSEAAPAIEVEAVVQEEVVEALAKTESAPEKPKAEPVEPEPDRPKRSGWWQRKGFF